MWNDISFGRGGTASSVYDFWLRAASWNDESGFNKSAVLSTFIKQAAVLFRADVFASKLRANCVAVLSGLFKSMCHQH